MRINKKLINKKHIKQDTGKFNYDTNTYDKVGPEYVRVDFKNWTALLIPLAFAVCVLGMFQLVHYFDHKNDARYNKICDMMAGNEPHYVSGNPNSSAAQCVIGKDFIRKDI